MEFSNTPTIASVRDTIDTLNAPGSIRRESAAGSLDSADFLLLMTAQLANQDPLEPQSNEQMLAQLGARQAAQRCGEHLASRTLRLGNRRTA